MVVHDERAAQGERACSARGEEEAEDYLTLGANKDYMAIERGPERMIE